MISRRVNRCAITKVFYLRFLGTVDKLVLSSTGLTGRGVPDVGTVLRGQPEMNLAENRKEARVVNRRKGNDKRAD